MPRLSHRPDRLRHLRRPRPGHHTLWLLLALLLLGGGSAQGADLPSRYRALIIAIDRYEDPGWAPLQAAVFDGEAIAARLQAQFGFEEVTTLFNEEATHAGMQDALKRFLYEAGPHDNLLLVFSGHGYHDAKDGFWVPHDGLKPTGAPTEGWLDSQLLSLDQLKRRVHLTPAQHLLIVADSCFSGALATLRGERRGPEGEPPTWWEEGWYEDLEAGKSIEVITSGGIEPVLDQVRTADEALFDGHSPFAWALLDALEGMEMPRRSAAELFADVGKRAAYAFRELGAVDYQQPRFGALNPPETQRVGSFVWRNKAHTSGSNERAEIQIQSKIVGDVYFDGIKLSRQATQDGGTLIYAPPGQWTVLIESPCLKASEIQMVVVQPGEFSVRKSLTFSNPQGLPGCVVEDKPLLQRDLSQIMVAYDSRKLVVKGGEDFSNNWTIVYGDGKKLAPFDFLSLVNEDELVRKKQAQKRGLKRSAFVTAAAPILPSVPCFAGVGGKSVPCLVSAGLGIVSLTYLAVVLPSMYIHNNTYYGLIKKPQAQHHVDAYNKALLDTLTRQSQSSLPSPRPKKVAFSLTPAGLSVTF